MMVFTTTESPASSRETDSPTSAPGSAYPRDWTFETACYRFSPNGLEFNPFGQTFSQSGTYADANPWRFSTKQMEPAWNLYYYGYRSYSPNLQVWLSRDPIEEDSGVQIYGFVENAPVHRFDVLGLAPLDCRSISIRGWAIPFGTRLSTSIPTGILGTSLGIQGGISADTTLTGMRCDICCSDGSIGHLDNLSVTGQGRVELSASLGWMDLNHTYFGYQFGVRLNMVGNFGVRGSYTGNSCTRRQSLRVGGIVSATGSAQGGGAVWLGDMRLQAWAGVHAGFTVRTGLNCNENNCLFELGSMTLRYGFNWTASNEYFTFSGTVAERVENLGTVGTWNIGTTPQFIRGLLD